jgi:glycosyltransferase involved in cell wall biosynthesis
MLRVLTLSTLFPDAGRPNFGGFVERQTLGLAALADTEVAVAAGVPLPPWPLSLHPALRSRRDLPLAEEWKGLRVVRPRFLSVPGWPSNAGRALARAVERRLPIAPDVIDAEFFWPDGVAAMHLSRRLNIPFSVKARGSDIHYWGERPGVRGQMLEAAGEAGALLACSAALCRSMAELGMPEGKIQVHHTGIDLDRFRPADRGEAKARLGIAGPLLVSVGALIPLKGQRFVIEALADLPEATLILAGDGPERRPLEALARSRGVAERVRFAGNVPHGELPALLAAADAMVLPSEREGLANAWVEALACGAPLVITDVGGAREVVDRPEAGLIVERSARAIVEAVHALLRDPPDPNRVRAAAQRFSWDRNARELRAHLARLSGERH